MTDKTLAGLFFTLVFIVLLGLMAAMMAPFFSSIVFGLILAGIFTPVHSYLMDRWNFHRYISATSVCLIIILAIFLPMVFLTVRLSQEALIFYNSLKSSLTLQTLQNALFGEGLIAGWLRSGAEMLNIDYTWENFQNLFVTGAQQLSLKVFESVNGWVGNVFNFLLQFFMMLLVVFAVMVEGTRLKEFLLELSPLPNDEEELVIERFNQMSFVSLVCNGLGGVIQGGLAGMAFWALGIGSPLLWTAMMVILAFIPLVGMSVVYIPACAYLLIAGHTINAIMLFTFCTVVALFVENWFKPWFMGGRVEMNSILIFFAILGGMAQFGIAGIFYGPLIVTVFLVFTQLYHDKYAPKNREPSDDGFEVEHPPSSHLGL